MYFVAPVNESLPFHSPDNPMPTKSKFNPYDYNPNNSNGTLNNAKFKRRLLRVHGEMNGWMDGWMDEWMDGRLDGQMDGWTNGQKDG